MRVLRPLQGIPIYRRSFARGGDDCPGRSHQSGVLSQSFGRGLDLKRAPNRHLSFGTGIHFRLGHQLARIEARCAIRALFERWPNLRLAVPEEQIRWRERPGLRALASLPVKENA